MSQKQTFWRIFQVSTNFSGHFSVFLSGFEETQIRLPKASADVKAIAYEKALEGRVNAPQVQMEEEGVTMMAQWMVMAYRSNASTTNNESLFQSCYVEGFTAGYQFAAYAATQGYVELMQRLDEQERLVVLMRFSYLRYGFPMEAPIVGTLATLQEIYQRSNWHE